MEEPIVDDIEIEQITSVEISLDRTALTHLIERLKEMDTNYSIRSGNIILKFTLVD